MSGPELLLKKMSEVSVEDILLPVLLQLAVIIAAARLFAYLARKIGQPAVIGEILAGLALGPSLLGALAPGLFAALFRPHFGELPPGASDLLVSRALMAIAQVGLVLLLFLVGLEFDFGHVWPNGRATLAISVVGVAVPFGLGILLGCWLHPQIAGDKDIAWLAFVLFLGVSLSITALPVLGRMMLDWGITRSRLGSITISAAAANDAIGWALLAAVAAISRSQLDLYKTAGMVLAAAGFCLVMALLVRPLLSPVVRAMLKAGKGELGVDSLAALLVILFVCAIVTNLIGIFAIFGAFILGAVLSGEEGLRDAVNRRTRDFVTAFFLPVFFAYTGLRTNIGTLETPHLWLLAGVVILAAVAGKFVGCGAAAWLSGMRLREATCVGAMMNTRGLVELVVINVGKDLGVIPDSVYCMLVLMALVTTFMTTPILMAAMRGTELEPLIRESGFLGPAKPA